MALPRLVARALKELEMRLRAELGARLRDMRLFGSFARGDAGPDSDVDVLVILDQVAWADRRKVIDVAADVGLEADLLISPTVFDEATYEKWRRQERPLVMAIEKEGVRP